MSGHTTQYGFVWHAATVTRCVEDKGAVWLNVETPRQAVEIHVTKTGLIRVRKLELRK